jgi:hypothetical protein
MYRIVTGLAAAAALVCLATPAVASQPDRTGCPGKNTGYELWDVSAEPYGVDNYVDDIGNQDGWACAKPTYVVLDDEGNPFQIYSFLDNKYPVP